MSACLCPSHSARFELRAKERATRFDLVSECDEPRRPGEEKLLDLPPRRRVPVFEPAQLPRVDLFCGIEYEPSLQGRAPQLQRGDERRSEAWNRRQPRVGHV